MRGSQKYRSKFDNKLRRVTIMDNAYQWVPFYEALADKLLVYSDKRDETPQLIRKARQGYAN
jgi:hypothetical protein